MTGTAGDPESSGSEADCMETGGVAEVMDFDDDEPTSKFQKEIWQLTLLPYYEDVVKEADHQLSVIKHGLASSILLREMKPGVVHWLIELDKYCGLYSKRFTKVEHVWFIDTCVALLTMKDLDFRVVKIIAHVLSSLMQKRELLSRDDVSIPWRPLYELYVTVCYKNVEDDGLLLLPDEIKESLETLIAKSRDYFPLDATRQILDEVRPYMCPWDSTMIRAAHTLALFLPTCLSAADHRQHGAGLWFDEMWFWYESLENSPPWESKFLYCFSRLARESPQFVREWSASQLDLLFSRRLRSLELQLGGGTAGGEAVLVGNGAAAFPADAAAQFFAWIMGGPDNLVQSYLTRFFKAIESYLYPSNYGRWQQHVLAFMLKLSHAVCLRLHRERHRKPDWTPLPDKQRYLTDEQVDDFVQSLLPCAVLGIFSKGRMDLSSGVIRYLAYLAPKLVVPAVLEKVYPALETLTEPHRLLQSLTCLVAVSASLVRDVGYPPELPHSLGAARRSKSQAVSVDESPVSPSTTAQPAASQPKRRRVHEMTVGEFEKNRGARCHVLPLLTAVLPGLDANDIGKTMLTFQTVGLFCALVPLVDCSEAVHLRDDLTDEEKELCSATALLEDFANQLMDKMFSLILTSGAQNHSVASGGGAHAAINARGNMARSMEENMLRNGIFNVFRTVVGNCSTPIYRVAVDRLYDFVKENIFDSRVAADTVAEMIFSAVRTNPEESLPLFLDLVIGKLESHITEETWAEEETDASLLWYLVLSSQLVRTAGHHLIQHKPRLLRLLELVLPLSSKEAYQITSTLLEHLLLALTSIYLDNYEEKRRKLDQPLDKYLPIRHWAEPCSKKRMQIIWHVPCEEELAFVDEIFKRFLVDELKRLDTPQDRTKEALQRSLSLVKACVAGAACVLPPLDGDPVSVVETLMPFETFTYRITPRSVRELTLTVDGTTRNVRNVAFETLHRLLDYLLKNREDDAQSLTGISRIYAYLIFHRGIERSRFDGQLKGYQMSKKIVGDTIRGRKSDIEAVTQEFSLIQQHKRLLARSGYSFSTTHRTMVSDLLRLATSHYSHVRRDAQVQVETCFSAFPYVYQFYLDDIVKYLVKDDNITHEQFKGALYVLLNGKRMALPVRHTWQTLVKTWPALVTAQHSEKPSVIQLLEHAQNTVVDHLESFQIRFQMPDGVDTVARRLWGSACLNDSENGTPPSEQMIEKGKEAERLRSDQNEKLYYELADKLLQLSTDSDLHWRHADMAQSLLSLLIRRDQAYPPGAVQLFTRLMIHDSVKTRKMSSSCIGTWLRIERPKALKTAYVPTPMPDQSKLVGSNWPIRWGITRDVERLMYRRDELPVDEPAWERMKFVDKTHWGVYTWPKELLVYKPPSEQFLRNRSRDQLTDAEKTLVDLFQDKDFLEKFAELNSLEEKKGEDEFNPMNYNLFKGLFCNMSDACLESLKPMVESLIESDKEGKQRLAAEIIAGLIQGSKLWQFSKLEAMWMWLKPTLQKALEERVTSETVKNWGTALATAIDSRDPRRLHWLVELLLESAQKPSESSFHTTSRFYFLQGCLNQVEFRVMECWRRLWVIMEPLLPSVYQNLRDRLGSCLGTILWFELPDMTIDVEFESSKPLTMEDVFASLTRKLEPILFEMKDGYSTLRNNASSSSLGDRDSGATTPSDEIIKTNGGTESKEWKEAVLLLKTMLTYASAHWIHGYRALPTPLLTLLVPTLCHVENETADEELRTCTRLQLRHGFSKAVCHADKADECLRLCQQILLTTSRWKCKVSVLRYLQVSVFSNYFCYSTPTTITLLRQLVFQGLTDDRLEVRECAGETLAGLLLCGFLPVSDGLLVSAAAWLRAGDIIRVVFQTQCRKLATESNGPSASKRPAMGASGDTLRVVASPSSGVLVSARRHAGVLGLSAVVAAHPYAVPSFLPAVLMDLCRFVRLPPPVQGTVKKALSEFKRTHQDSWHEHKTNFSDDQLAVLTDLLVSPNYYV